MKWFYIRFTYDHYCQGWDEEQETLMVQAIDFFNACRLIGDKYEKARNFKDLTIRETEHF
jgi:hypothetical protein